MSANPELKIARIAEGMMQRALLTEIRSLGLQLSNDTADRKNKKLQKITPLLQSTAHKRMVKGDRRKMASVAIHMGRQGFIHHYGVDGYRESHEVISKKGTRFTRKGHRMKLQSKDFIERAVQRSGVIPYLQTELGAIRANEFMIEISKAFQ